MCGITNYNVGKRQWYNNRLISDSSLNDPVSDQQHRRHVSNAFNTCGVSLGRMITHAGRKLMATRLLVDGASVEDVT